jgi:hypothetical protein
LDVICEISGFKLERSKDKIHFFSKNQGVTGWHALEKRHTLLSLEKLVHLTSQVSLIRRDGSLTDFQKRRQNGAI